MTSEEFHNKVQERLLELKYVILYIFKKESNFFNIPKCYFEEYKGVVNRQMYYCSFVNPDNIGIRLDDVCKKKIALTLCDKPFLQIDTMSLRCLVHASNQKPPKWFIRFTIRQRARKQLYKSLSVFYEWVNSLEQQVKLNQQYV